MGQFEFLEKPFDGFKEGEVEKFQDKCLEIATTLFNEYGIKCDEKIFRFAEIEFYYYEKGKWEEDWNKVTYARDGYNGGDLFFHLSGVDICFDSLFASGRFGGILVRSIVDKDKNLIAGPWNTMLCILNESKGSSMPSLIKLTESRSISLTAIHRALGEKDMENFENNNQLKLCFYDDKISEWKNHKVRYSKNQKGVNDVFGEVSSNYNRF